MSKALIAPANELTFVELLDQYIETRTQIREMTSVGARPVSSHLLETYRDRFDEIRKELELRTKNV